MQARDANGQVVGTHVRMPTVTGARLLWRLANQSTLDTLRDKSPGQYDIRLGRSTAVAEFFSDLPRIVDHKGFKIELTTERLPLVDKEEIPPYELVVRRMSEKSKRSAEWYIRAQRSDSAYPLWRPGRGPEKHLKPDRDHVLLIRTGNDLFYAGWLRKAHRRHIPIEVRRGLEGRPIGVAPLSLDQLSLVIAAMSPVGKGEIEVAPAEREEVEQGLVEAQEGRRVTVMHVRRERSRKLRAAKVAAAGGNPTCEACGFDFEQVYGERGQGFIECHHLTSVTKLDPAIPTTLEDLALLCANCHRMIHAKQPWLTMEELEQLLP